MDPLSITTAIVGLLGATAQVSSALSPYISATRETPKIATQVHSEVVYTRTILVALDGLTKNLASIPRKRTSLIQISQLRAVFTDGVLLFSELEVALPSPPPTTPTSPRVSFQVRLQWARKESDFIALLGRLQSFKIYISCMLTILQRQVIRPHFYAPAKYESDSDLNAVKNQEELSQNVAALLKDHESLSQRLENLQDAFEACTIISKRKNVALTITHNDVRDDTSWHQQSTGSSGIVNVEKNSNVSKIPENALISSFDFEDDLEASRVYRRAQRNTMDFSFRSSIAHTNAWSVFSGLSLSDISIISAIALPLYPSEIGNAQHYQLEISPTVADNLPNNHSDSVDELLLKECNVVERKLARMPAFSSLFAEPKTGAAEEDSLPFLIRVFKTGFPLLTLLGRVPGLENRVSLTEVANQIISQTLPKEAAMLKFTRVCIYELGVEPEECFTVGDLMGNDTAGFLKVIRIIARVLRILNSRARANVAAPNLTLLSATREHPFEQTSPPYPLIERLLLDQRSYVVELEGSIRLRRKIAMHHSLQIESLDLVSHAFILLNRLIGIETQFLLQMEIIVRESPGRQSWSSLLDIWSSMRSPYTAFFTHEKEAKYKIETLLAIVEILRVELTASVLRESLRLLCLPSECLQRRYDFFQQIQHDGDVSDSQSCDFLVVSQGFQNALVNIHDAIKDEELSLAHSDLVLRLYDWKDNNLTDFGELLLFDVLTVFTGKHDMGKYHVYLFERIIIFCREENRSYKRTGRISWSCGGDKGVKTKPDLVVRGRVLAIHLTCCLPSSSQDGIFTCKIRWEGDPGETTMSFLDEVKMRTWYEGIEGIRKAASLEVQLMGAEKSTPESELPRMENMPAELLSSPATEGKAADETVDEDTERKDSVSSNIYDNNDADRKDDNGVDRKLDTDAEN